MKTPLQLASLILFLFIAVSYADEPATGETEEKTNAEWISLFDGKTLDGWRGYNGAEIDGIWVVDSDGSLHLAGQPEGTPYVNLITNDQFADFEFSFEWKIEEGTNSGVLFRVGEGPNHPYLTGPEYQVLDNEGFRSKKGEPVSTAEQTASHYAIEPAASDETKPIGEWNEGRILARGNTVEYWLNAVKTTEYEIDSPEWKEQVANSKFSKWKDYATLKKGHIGLQDHGHRVWYRNLKIRELKD